ncbi:hypothetical protein [Streptomyces platensis]|uniref:hypothetical protein n=1 Tax=Streptomyces platensis TaxID=58346 RepID=UPI002F9171F4|nr:hypothetical protein OG962_37530 [Streptomyces platensis]
MQERRFPVARHIARHTGNRNCPCDRCDRRRYRGRLKRIIVLNTAKGLAYGAGGAAGTSATGYAIWWVFLQ